MSEDSKFKAGFRLRHRIAHISISLAVILVASLALFGYLTNRQWMGLASMSPNTAVCLLLLAALELFEAFNLKV